MSVLLALSMLHSISIFFLITVVALADTTPDVFAGSYVVGGTEAFPGSYPYVVDLTASNGVHRCMGSLIAPDLVLTAGHCQDISKYAHVGRLDSTDTSGERFTIIAKHRHPNFDASSLEFDFAVCQLDRSSDATSLILNRNKSLPAQGQELNVAGFGSTSIAPQTRKVVYPQVLQEVTVRAHSSDTCKGSYGSRLNENCMFCAGAPGRDSCIGDSGSPAILMGEFAEDDLQIGLVSWGEECADPLHPGVYGKVSEAFDWIQTVVCEESESPPAYFDC